MALKDFFQNIFTKVNTDKIRDPLSFVHLFGHERGQGLPQPQDFDKFVGAYRSWAYACAKKNGDSVAKVPLKLYSKRRIGKEWEKEEVIDHPFLEVINAVNPFSNRFELFSLTQIYLELTGNAYWWIPRDRFGIPYMIWNIPAHWVKIMPSKENFIEGYMVQPPGAPKGTPFIEQDIIHFRNPSPFDLFYGIGSAWGASYGIDLNKHTKQYGISFFENHAQPTGVLMSEAPIGEETQKRLRQAWNAKYRGSTNAGKIAILTGGLKYEKIGSNLKDASFDQVSRETRDEILAMFGVPPSKLGLVEDVNRANADANDYTYQKETVFPRLKLIEEKLNEKFVSIYPQKQTIKLLCEFENPVPEDKDFRLREKEVNVRTGITTIDEERQKDGLEELNLPETQVPLIPFNLSPAGSPKPEPMLPFQPGGNDEEEDDEEKRNPQAVEKSVEKARGDAKWHTFVRMTAPHEKALERVLKRYFQAQHSDVMRRLNQFKSVQKDLFSSIMFNMNEQNDKLKISSEGNVRNAFIAGLTLGSADVGSDIDFDLFEPNIARSVDVRMSFFVGRVNKSTSKLLGDAINEGLANGESIADISKRVDGIFQFSESFRAKRIAQTEVIGATNDGQLKAYVDAGVTMKEWLTARDEHVRDSHQIEGQQVPIAESFTTGEGNRLQYPGDRSSGAPASDIINCRCTVSPVIKGA